HNYCNRTCWFCPNAQIDRRSSVILLAENTYNKILSNLQEIDYSQTLVWSRYHEALAHPSIVNRLAKARKLLPNAYLALISNGDYLDHEMLNQLEAAGLDRLMLDLYLTEGKERDKEEINKGLEKFQSRTGLGIEEIKGEKYNYNLTGTNIKITMGIPFYNHENLSSRAGLVEHPQFQNYHRKSICFYPLRSITIDYNGKGVLCCQTRSDATKHKEAIIGDLSESSYTIFHLYRDMSIPRHYLFTYGFKKGVCEKCNINDDVPMIYARYNFLTKLIQQIPGIDKAFNRLHSLRKQTRRWE
ncbi:MAG: radical SAM protein, partial [Candidatus Melainabacteria bacterium]|nr:radical SAM protein [Candidatus Melainabacteria bacterium]